MAVYAPGTEGHVKVASLVEASPGGGGALSALRVDGKTWTLGGWAPEAVLRQDVYVCETAEEYQLCLSSVDMAEELKDWRREGYLGGRWYGEDPEAYGRDGEYADAPQADLADWYRWNSLNGSSQPQSYQALTGQNCQLFRWPAGPWTPSSEGDLSGRLLGRPFWFWNGLSGCAAQGCAAEDASYWLSRGETTKYDVTVELHSECRDDDALGFVAAAYRDGAGRTRTLSFVRAPNVSDPETLAPMYHFYPAGADLGVDASEPPWWPEDGSGAVSASFRPTDLSTCFFRNKAAFQKRFTGLDEDGFPRYHPDDPDDPREPVWEYWPDEVVSAWSAAALSSELCLATAVELKQVVPGFPDPVNGWPMTDVPVDLSRLSAPENWWWMSNAQWEWMAGRGWSQPYFWKGVNNNLSAAKTTRLRVARDGDAVSAWTTSFYGRSPKGFLSGLDTYGLWEYQGGNPWPEDAAGWEDAVARKRAFKMTVDLSKPGRCNGVELSAFSTAARPRGCGIGLASKGQPGSTWKFVEFKVPKTLVRLYSNDVVEYDPIADQATRLKGVLPADACGRGRLCRNPATGKTFYVLEDAVVKVSG